MLCNIFIVDLLTKCKFNFLLFFQLEIFPFDLVHIYVVMEYPSFRNVCAWLKSQLRCYLNYMFIVFFCRLIMCLLLMHIEFGRSYIVTTGTGTQENSNTMFCLRKGKHYI